MSDEAVYGALERKVGGAIRSAISNCPQPSLSVLTKVLSSEEITVEQAEKRALLEARAKEARRIFGSSELDDIWEVYPSTAATSCA